MSACSRTAYLVAFLNGDDLADLTYDSQLHGTDEMWKSSRPVPLSNTLANARCVPALTATEITSRYVGF